jgi:hypothetical protein
MAEGQIDVIDVDLGLLVFDVIEVVDRVVTLLGLLGGVWVRRGGLCVRLMLLLCELVGWLVEVILKLRTTFRWC